MRTEQKVFNDLIETIVRNSENNIATITDVKLLAKTWQTEMKQELALTSVGSRLPIGTEITIVDKPIWGALRGSKKVITGYCDYMGEPLGYMCDDEGIFLIGDFER